MLNLLNLKESDEELLKNGKVRAMYDGFNVTLECLNHI